MTYVTAEKLEAELSLCEFEVAQLVEGGVLAAESSGKFDLGWCRLALRAWRLREPGIVDLLRKDAADKVPSFWCRAEILARSPAAGPEAHARLRALGQEAIRHLRLLAAVTSGRDRDRHLMGATEIEGALDRLSCPRAAE